MIATMDKAARADTTLTRALRFAEQQMQRHVEVTRVRPSIITKGDAEKTCAHVAQASARPMRLVWSPGPTVQVEIMGDDDAWRSESPVMKRRELLCWFEGYCTALMIEKRVLK